MTKKEKALLFILASINFTHIMDFMIMMPLQEYLVPVFNITPRQFSFLVSAYAFSAGISSITASFFVDRFDRKKMLLSAYSGFIIGTIACAFAPSYNLLMLARIVAGVFGGLIGAQGLSIVGDTFPYEKRGRAMGILMSAFSFAAIAGVPIGLYLASKYSWHVPFLLIGILGCVLLPLAFFIIPSMTSHIVTKNKIDVLNVYKGILDNRNQQLGLLMMFTLILSHFSIIPFIAPYLEKNVYLTKNQVTWMYFFGGIVSLISSPIIGKLSDKYGKFKILSLFLVLSTLPVFLITNMSPMAIYVVIAITSTFFLFGGGRMIPAQALITSVVSPQQRGGFMNINSSLQQIGTGLASFMAGSIVSKNEISQLTNYHFVGYIGIFISIVCIFIAKKVKPLDSLKNE